MNQTPPPLQQPTKRDYYRNENLSTNALFLRVALDGLLLFFCLGWVLLGLFLQKPLTTIIGVVLLCVSVVRIFQNRSKAKRLSFGGEIRKIDDFFRGLLLAVILYAMILELEQFLPILAQALPMLIIIGPLLLTIFCISRGRVYLGIGILSIMIIPFLVLGTCSGILTIYRLSPF